MADVAPAAAPSALEDTNVVSLEPPEQGEGINRETAKPAETAKPESVDLKVWAKTSAEARKNAARVKELEAEIEKSKGNVNTDPAAVKQAAIELLKTPGIGKLLKESGRDTQSVLDEFLADPEADDPEKVEQRNRLSALEKELADKKEKDKTDEETRKKQASDKERGEGLKSVTGFVEKNAEALIDNATDPRDGTPRWVMVNGDADAISHAYDLVVAYLDTHQEIPEEKRPEVARQKLELALDKIEIQLRKPLASKLAKLAPQKRIIPRGDKKEVLDTDWRPKTDVSPLLHIDRSLTSGPAPDKKPKTRFSSGPSKVVYASEK